MISTALKSQRRATLGLVLAFVVLLPAVTVRLNASDEIQYFAWLRSWVFDRDANFENEYRYFHDQAPEKHHGLRQTFLEDVNEAGRRPNFTPIGTALLWAPFYLAGHAAAMSTGAPRDGFSYPYLAAVTYGSAIYGLLALILAADFTRRAFQVPPGAAVWVTWLGTPLLFYMYVAPGFSHATSAFGVSLVLWVWVQVRREWTPRGVALLGAVAALLPMIREQDVFFVIGPACDFAIWSVRGLRAGTASARTAVVRAIAGLFAAAVVYTPQVLAYIALNGHFGPTTKVSRKMSWSSPHFVEVLFSPNHGLFVWTPLSVIALVGLAALIVRARHVASDTRRLSCLLVLMVAAQAYVSGAVESWTVAGSFGQRRFVAITPILVAGVAAAAALTPARRPWRVALLASLVLAVWWNVGLMALFGLHRMDRQRLEIGPNAAAVFRDLPREVPFIAWRYLTNRTSLYDLPRRE